MFTDQITTPTVEDEELLTSTMPTRRENTTLKMPGLLNTNGGAVAEHGLPTQRKKTTLTGECGTEDLDGGSSFSETCNHFTQTKRKEEEEKMVRGHEEEEGQRGREGGREMNHFFKKKKLSQGYKGIFASTAGCTSKNARCT